MAAMHMQLDPTKMGSGGRIPKQNLRGLIVGQDEAIQAIIGAYQMYLRGLSAPGGADCKSDVSRTHGIGQDSNRGSDGRMPA